MSNFNLVEEPWIPCIDFSGKNVELGIRKTLLKADQLQEIYDGSPLVTVAVHRLLLAILYRALEGPKDFKSWKDVYGDSSFYQHKVTAYFSKHKESFYLTDAEHPFFQMAELEIDKPSPITRLSTECASGNNATLFDHNVDGKAVSWPAAKAAKALIECQSFALGFGRSAEAIIDGKKEKLPYSADASALRGMNIWLQGTTLFETLMINLVPIDNNTPPPWEMDDPHKYRDRLNGRARTQVASFGVVDRYTWQSRLIRLIPEDGVFSRAYFTQGRSADTSPGDPMKVYRISGKKGITALPLRPEKAAWRDAHAILTISVGTSKEQRPWCFNHFARARLEGVFSPDKRVTVQVAGVATEPGKSGKFLLWRHDRLPLPAELFSDPNMIERLGGLIQNAERAAVELRIRTYALVKRYLEMEKKDVNKDEVARFFDSIDPRPAFWGRMEKYFLALVEQLPEDWDNGTGGWRPDEEQLATNSWREAVKKEARQALEESVLSLGTTARAIKAGAQLKIGFYDEDLFPKPPKR